MSRFYQIHQLAELARVTIKTPHHYDKLGLFPLNQIKLLLAGQSVELRNTLRSQRKA